MTPDPMRREYDKLKSAHNNAVLLVRLGEVYEVYYEDADLLRRVFGAKRYQIKRHEADRYIKTLTALGFPVQKVEE